MNKAQAERVLSRVKELEFLVAQETAVNAEINRLKGRAAALWSDQQKKRKQVAKEILGNTTGSLAVCVENAIYKATCHGDTYSLDITRADRNG